ncbi:MAG: hypothetical protein ACYDA6_03170 [Solirubrobacteraceae bacterium]
MRRPARQAALALVLALALAGVSGAYAPAPAQAAGAHAATAPNSGGGGGGGGGPCGVLGGVPVLGPAIETGCEAAVGPLVGAVWHGLGDLLGGLGGKVTEAAEHLIAGAASGVLNSVSGWIASGAVWLVSKVAGLVNTTTSPDVTASWFTAPYGTIAKIAWLLAAPLLLIAIIRGAVMRDWGELLRPVGWYLPLAAVMTAGAVLVTQMAIRTSDAMSSMVAGSLGTNVHAFFSGVAKGVVLVSVAGSGLPSFVIAVFAVFLAMCAFVVWIELLLRSAAIYVVVLFLPLAFVAMIWPRMAVVARRMVELLAAVIWSKFIIIAIVAMAASALVHAGLGSHVDATLSGIVLLGMAMFAPWSLLRLIPLVEAGVAHAGHLSSDARATAQRGQARVSKASDAIKQAAGSQQGPAGAEGGAGAPTGAGASGAGAAVGGAAGAGGAGAGGAGAGGAGAGGAGAGGAAGAALAPVVAGVAVAGAARRGSERAGAHIERHARGASEGSETGEQQPPTRPSAATGAPSAAMANETSSGAGRAPVPTSSGSAGEDRGARSVPSPTASPTATSPQGAPDGTAERPPLSTPRAASGEVTELHVAGHEGDAPAPRPAAGPISTPVLPTTASPAAPATPSTTPAPAANTTDHGSPPRDPETLIPKQSARDE